MNITQNWFPHVFVESQTPTLHNSDDFLDPSLSLNQNENSVSNLLGGSEETNIKISQHKEITMERKLRYKPLCGYMKINMITTSYSETNPGIYTQNILTLSFSLKSGNLMSAIWTISITLKSKENFIQIILLKKKFVIDL